MNRQELERLIDARIEAVEAYDQTAVKPGTTLHQLNQAAHRATQAENDLQDYLDRELGP